MILRFYEWRPVPQNPTSYCAEKDSEFYETKRLENNLSLFFNYVTLPWRLASKEFRISYAAGYILI